MRRCRPDRPWPSGRPWNEALQAKIRALLVKYPYVSVENRLTYEMTPRPRMSPKLVKASDERLKEMESGFGQFDQRVMSLAALHSREVRSFVQRNGFGMDRMGPSTSPKFLSLPPAESIPFAASPLRGDIGPMVNLPAKLPEGGGDGLPSQEGLANLHVQSVREFARATTLGLVISRKKVSGFQSHHFGSMPSTGASPGREERWAITRRLVSLLKHGKPGVYLSDSLPHERGCTARLRPLTPFEQSRCNSQRGRGFRPEPARKADPDGGLYPRGKQCMKCHNVERGELLGITYHLQRRQSAK